MSWSTSYVEEGDCGGSRSTGPKAQTPISPGSFTRLDAVLDAMEEMTT